jgi:hypothetical protein
MAKEKLLIDNREQEENPGLKKPGLRVESAFYLYFRFLFYTQEEKQEV